MQASIAPAVRALRPSAGKARLAPRVQRRQCRVRAQIEWSVNGRDVDVDAQLRNAVIDRLSPAVQKMEGPEYLEVLGGVTHVNVSLMSTMAEIYVQPKVFNEEFFNTLLRRGQLYASAAGYDCAWDCFEAAAEQLERKLEPMAKYTTQDVQVNERATVHAKYA